MRLAARVAKYIFIADDIYTAARNRRVNDRPSSSLSVGAFYLPQLMPASQPSSAQTERKCADTTGTVPVPWAGRFQR